MQLYTHILQVNHYFEVFSLTKYYNHLIVIFITILLNYESQWTRWWNAKESKWIFDILVSA